MQTSSTTIAPPQPGADASDRRPSPPSAAVTRMRRIFAPLHPFVWLPLAVTLVVLAIVWDRVAENMPYLLPPLGAVGETLVAEAGYYIANAAITLGEALAGLVVGFVSAFVVAVLVSELPVVRRAVLPLAVVLNVTPIVAIAPALVVAFGFGPLPKIVIASLICFFPILINTATGLRSVPAPVMQVYRTINASRAEILVHLRVPNALPFVFAALRIVFPLSIIGAVVAELSASGAMGGLGTVISVASSMNQLAVVYASIFVLALLGILLLGAVVLLERRLLRWHAAATT